jgi:hypothetical protein
MDGQLGRDQLRRDLEFPVQAACSALHIVICQNHLGDRHGPTNASIAQFIRKSRLSPHDPSGLSAKLSSICVRSNPPLPYAGLMIPFLRRNTNQFIGK